MLSQTDVKDMLTYDPSTGVFKWKKKRRGVRTGIALGSDNGFGYLRISVLGRSYYAHRLAWFYTHGEWPETIDHINGIKSDNRIENLRSCSQLSNNQNRLKKQSNNKSLALGVSWHKRSKKWQAHICIYKERKYLGLFSSIDKAHAAYLKEKDRVRLQQT